LDKKESELKKDLAKSQKLNRNSLKELEEDVRSGKLGEK
jgi:hypothetical protein